MPNKRYREVLLASQKNPQPVVVRLLQLKAEQEKVVSEGKTDITQVSSSGATQSSTL